MVSAHSTTDSQPRDLAFASSHESYSEHPIAQPYENQALAAKDTTTPSMGSCHRGRCSSIRNMVRRAYNRPMPERP